MNERTYDEALNFWAARGFSMPPGVLTARLKEALTEQTRADAALNKDIAIEQARLAKEHQQFIISSGLQMESRLMDYANVVAGRAFESAKFTAQIAVDIFNAKVQKYNADLETYKTAAAVYESQVRAGLLELERYKAQLEGVRLSADIQAQAIEVYRLRLAGVETLVNLYRTEMENARIRSDVEMKRIEAFRAKVDAFTARIGAKTAEFNLYQARIAGEQAKAEVYSRQVEAFGRQVDAAKTEADIRIAQAGAVLEADKQKIEKVPGRYRDVRLGSEKGHREGRSPRQALQHGRGILRRGDPGRGSGSRASGEKLRGPDGSRDQSVEREAQGSRDQHECASGRTSDASQNDRSRNERGRFSWRQVL